jgi:hypothetical protein
MDKKPREKKENINLNFRTDAFLSDSLNMYVQRMLQEENKANWLMAASALLLGLSFPEMSKGINLSKPGIIVIFIAAACSLILSLFVFSVPNFLIRSPHIKKTLMYYRPFDYSKPEEYIKNLKKIAMREDIIEQYGYTIINLVNRNISVKIKIIRVQVAILFTGILLGTLLIFLE